MTLKGHRYANVVKNQQNSKMQQKIFYLSFREKDVHLCMRLLMLLISLVGALAATPDPARQEDSLRRARLVLLQRLGRLFLEQYGMSPSAYRTASQETAYAFQES